MLRKLSFLTSKQKTDLAEHMKITTQTLNNWRIMGIPHKNIDSLCEDFECNKQWVRTGDGTMKSETIVKSEEDTLLKIFGLNEEEISLEFIKVIHELKPANKHQLVDIKELIRNYLKNRRKDIGKE